MESISNSSSTAPATTSAVALRYGLIFGLVSTVFQLVLLITATEQSPVRWLGVAISAGAVWVAHQDFKKRNGGFLEYGQGVGIAVLLTLISGSIGSLAYYLYVDFIDNSVIQRIIDKARTDMEARGGMDDAQIDQALEMTAKFTTPIMFLVFGILGSLLIGLLLGLIISAITKNSRPEFE